MTKSIIVPETYYDENDSTNVCFLCGKPEYALRYHVTHFDFPFTFQQCQCGLIKQTPMPNDQFFEWFFNSDVFFSSKTENKDHIWGYYDYFSDEPNRLETSKWRYKRLQHLFQPGPATLFQPGPATGTFLYTAQQDGHNVLGCDVSSQFREYAMTNYNVQIDHGRFERQPYADGQFDAVILLNVIENVPNQSEFLQAIHRTLRPGGHFILNYVEMHNNLIERFQKSKYFIYRPPICYAYTNAVIHQILAKFGFEVVEVHRDIRTLNVEKIVTLLGWKWALKLTRALKINRIPIRAWAYPSYILVARRLPDA